TRTRNGQTLALGNSTVRRPTQSPSSLYFSQLQKGDVITIGTVPASAPILSPDNSLVYNETNSSVVTNGFFTTLPFMGDVLLSQNWNDLNSFAGIVPGLHWNYGVPYAQTLHAVSNTVSVTSPGGTIMVLPYSPVSDQDTLALSPVLVLDDGTRLALSGHPVL